MSISDEVTIFCNATKCRNNMINTPVGDFGCNLKNVTIDTNGKCEDFIVKTDKAGRRIT